MAIHTAPPGATLHAIELCAGVGMLGVGVVPLQAATAFVELFQRASL